MIPNNGPGGHKTSKTHSYISQIIPLHDHLSPAIRRYGAWFWVWQPSKTGEKVVFISTTQNPSHCLVLCLFGKHLKSNDWVINYDLANFIYVEKDMMMSFFLFTTKPQLQSQNFFRENLICLMMMVPSWLMLVICRPLLQESSNIRLRKGS